MELVKGRRARGRTIPADALWNQCQDKCFPFLSARHKNISRVASPDLNTAVCGTADRWFLPGNDNVGQHDRA